MAAVSLIERRAAMAFAQPILAGIVLLALVPTAVASSLEAPPGAAACSGCHPARTTVGTPVPRLIGRDPSSVVAAMQEFRSGKRPATVMDRIAKGFSDDEIAAIAAWYGAQKD
jgi:cytochrome subunit of sulfide dehydrogenase